MLEVFCCILTGIFSLSYLQYEQLYECSLNIHYYSYITFSVIQKGGKGQQDCSCVILPYLRSNNEKQYLTNKVYCLYILGGNTCNMDGWMCLLVKTVYTYPTRNNFIQLFNYQQTTVYSHSEANKICFSSNWLDRTPSKLLRVTS